MTRYEIAFAPHLPPEILLVLNGIVVLLFGWLAICQIPGTLFRAAIAAVLLLVLANPALLEERREFNPDVALVIIDETPSQEAVGRIEGTRRAASNIEKALVRFSGSLEVRRVVLRHDSLSDGIEGTRVAESVREAIADVPDRRYAGAILVSDGQIHDAADIADLPSGPFHTLIIGERDTPDRRLVVVEAPSFGVVDEPIEVIIRVDDPTALPGDTIRPTVLLDGTPQRVARLPFNEDVPISLILDHHGLSVVEIRVPDLPDELSTINNQAVLSLNGVQDRLRVLLVSGEPHPGERTWRNLLKSDPSVDLVHFTILRPPEKQDGTPIDELSLIAFPTRELFEVKLHEFDLIVFDNYRRRGVLPSIYLANIVDYVRDGGALLDAAGPGFAGPFSLYRTPLGDILPLEPTGAVAERAFLPAVTAEGLRHPVTAGLPGGPDRSAAVETADWGKWLRQVDVIHRQGNIVMSGLDGQPLVALSRVPDGRVAHVSSDHIWLWARGYDGGGPQAELLRRMAHWLMKEPDLEEEDLRAVADGDRLEIRLRTLQERVEPQATVERPDGSVVDLSLERVSEGFFAASLPLSQSGLYRITEGEHTVLTAAGALNALEFSNLAATDSVLQFPVEQSGGRIYWAVDGPLPDIRRVQPNCPAGGSGWIGFVKNSDYTVVGLDSMPLIPGWLLFCIVTGLLAGAWYREAS